MLAEFPGGIELDSPDLLDGDTVTAAVRPEDLALTDNPFDGPSVAVLDCSYLGDHYQTRVTVGGLELTVHTDRRPTTDTLHLRLRRGGITLVN